MTVSFAITRIPLLMEELGYGKNYIIRWRHFQLSAGENLSVDASNQYYLLINPVAGIKVTSKSGTFDLSDTAISEMQYEHKGKIQVKNYNTASQLVLFIQVIPNHF
jgi:hypothetical protein